MYEWSAQCFVCDKVDARDEMTLILGDETGGMYRCKACDQRLDEENSEWNALRNSVE